MELPSDARQVELIEAVGAGDRDAFSALLDALGPFVLAAARRATGEDESAADVTAEVFAEVWAMAPLWDRHVGRPLLWAIALARSRIAARQQDARRRREIGPLVDRPEADAQAAARDPGAHVGGVLAGLSARQRDVLEAAWCGHPVDAGTVALPADDEAEDALRAFARALGGG